MSELKARNTAEAGTTWNGLISGVKVCRAMGISPVTAWRYGKAGMLKPIKIANRVFYRQSDLAEFEARALAGEFAKPASGAAAPMSKEI